MPEDSEASLETAKNGFNLFSLWRFQQEIAALQYFYKENILFTNSSFDMLASRMKGGGERYNPGGLLRRKRSSLSSAISRPSSIGTMTEMAAQVHQATQSRLVKNAVCF